MAMGLEEEERLTALRLWWKRYGNLVSVIVLILSASVLGYRGWEWYQQSQAEAAVGPYEELKAGIQSGDISRITGASDTLFKNYGQTSLATLGGMEAGKALFEKGELDAAKVRYQWVVDNGIKPEWPMMARLDLAQLLIDQEKFEEALAVLDVTPLPGFAARFASAKGDVYWVSGKRDEARQWYQAALKELADPPAVISPERSKQLNETMKQLVQYKLNAVGSVE